MSLITTQNAGGLLHNLIYKHLPFLDNTVSMDCMASVWQLDSEKFKDRIALSDDYNNLKLTFSEFFNEIKIFAGAFQKLGLKVNDKVALFSENSAKWMVLDQAVMLCRAVSAVRGSNAPLGELEYIYNHSDSKVLLTDNKKLILQLKNTLIKNQAAFVIYFGKEEIDENQIEGIKIYSYEKLRGIGLKHRYWRQNFEKNDPATIVYSSGTTGNPKGVLISHYNLLSQLKAIHPSIKIKPGFTFLAVLPIWHMYERTCEYYALSRGSTIVYTNIWNFKKDLKKYRPHYLISVPRIWETVYETVRDTIKTKPLSIRMLFGFLLFISTTSKKAKRVVNNACIYNEKFHLGIWLLSVIKTYLLMPIDKFANRTIYKKLREAMGGRLIKGISGGGAIPPRVEDFLEAIGLKLYVGYGLTETSPVVSVRREEKNKIYSVGPPLEGTQFKVVDPQTFQELPKGQKGLVLIKGPQVMSGYYKDPEATAKVMRGDWFISGDLGWLSKDGSLVLTGREKDIIVLSNGENIEPEGLENACSTVCEVNQLVIVGQDKANLCALVVLNEDNSKKWADKNSIKNIYNDKNFKKHVLDSLNREIRNRPIYRSFERINDIRYVKDPFTIENGMMTQSLKLKKNVIFNRYKKVIEEMY